MAIPLPKYAQIKDNYCVGYFGHDPSVVHSLKLARPVIERELPGLKLYIACHDKFIPILKDEPHIVPGSQLESRIKDYEFAYYRELEGGEKAVLEFLRESGIHSPHHEAPFPHEKSGAPA